MIRLHTICEWVTGLQTGSRRSYHVLVFFKLKTAYEVHMSDWSSDLCSSDLAPRRGRFCPRTPADSVLLREDSVRDVRANAAAAVRANAAESSATTRVLLIMPISLSSSNASLSAYTLPTTRGDRKSTSMNSSH